MYISSCGGLSGWSAGLWFLAAPEGLDDAHHAAAIRAWFSECERDDLRILLWFLAGLFRSKQGAGLCYTGLSTSAGQQTMVADAVKPIRRHMDEKAADELVSSELHGPLSVI